VLLKKNIYGKITYEAQMYKWLRDEDDENTCWSKRKRTAVIKFLVCRYVVNRLLINITHKLRKDVVMVVIPYQMKTGMVHSKFIFDMIF
jgi:hypothetical protein